MISDSEIRVKRDGFLLDLMMEQNGVRVDKISLRISFILQITKTICTATVNTVSSSPTSFWRLGKCWTPAATLRLLFSSPSSRNQRATIALATPKLIPYAEHRLHLPAAASQAKTLCAGPLALPPPSISRPMKWLSAIYANKLNNYINKRCHSQSGPPKPAGTCKYWNGLNHDPLELLAGADS
uniref:Uncharacterized protein n=1 Tax=Romanomermis culicivorax TaxID=13658 RepID=A0A915HE13_ROMCU